MKPGSTLTVDFKLPSDPKLKTYLSRLLVKTTTEISPFFATAKCPIFVTCTFGCVSALKVASLFPLRSSLWIASEPSVHEYKNRLPLESHRNGLRDMPPISVGTSIVCVIVNCLGAGSFGGSAAKSICHVNSKTSVHSAGRGSCIEITRTFLLNVIRVPMSSKGLLLLFPFS
jgi:hypothetical protein